MSMDKLELLYDHYKETYDLSKKAQEFRNRSYVVLCVLEAIAFLFLYDSEKTFELLKSGVNAQFGISFVFGSEVFQSLLWTLIVYVTIRYVQNTIYIERQYTYMARLEQKISSMADNLLFSREGESYLNDYPIVLNIIDLFYKMLSPFLFVCVNYAHIYREWMSQSYVTLSLLYDTILFIVSFIVTWFYFFQIHDKIASWCKAHIPLVGRIAIALRNILKEV